MKNANLTKLHSRIYGGEKDVCLALRKLITELTIQRDGDFWTAQINFGHTLVCDSIILDHIGNSQDNFEMK